MFSSLFAKMLSLTAKEISRDFLSLFFSFAFPLIFMVMFGLISRPGEPAPMQIGVVLEHPSARSEAFIKQLTRDAGLSIKMIAAGEVEKALNSASVGNVLRIRQQGADIAVEIVNQQTRNPYLRAAVNQAMFAVLHPESAANVQAHMQESQVQSNNNFATTFLIPGLTAMALLQLGLLGTANPVMTARARGTLLHLTLTPLPKSVLVGAHVVVRLVIAALQIALLLGIAVLCFKLPLQSGLLSVLLVNSLGALMLISLGFFIAGIVPNEVAGGSIVMLVNFLMMGLGDIFVSTENVTGLNWISALMPVTYLADASRQLTVGVSGRFPLALDIAVMLGLTVLFFLLAVKTFTFGMKKP